MTIAYRIADAAELIGLSARTLRRRIEAGEFPNAYRDGRELRVTAADLRAYVESRPKVARPAADPGFGRWLDETFGTVA